ncbi:MAG: hypothetical protein LCH30_08145 [Proteobacteria bacterium]|nr:hypothetical protein [Pseudomonadota bacterium]
MRTIAKKHKVLGAVLFAGFLAFSSAAAAHGGFHGGGWYGGAPGIVIGPMINPYYSGCSYVPGHWFNGYWVPAHRVCGY